MKTDKKSLLVKTADDKAGSFNLLYRIRNNHLIVVITKSAIYLSAFYALVYMFFATILTLSNFLLILLISLIIFALKLIAHFFVYRHKNISSDQIAVFLLFSLALGFFTAGFLNQDIKNMWNDFDANNDVYLLIAVSFFGQFLAYVPITIMIGPLIIFLFYFNKPKCWPIQIIGTIVYVVLFAIITNIQYNNPSVLPYTRSFNSFISDGMTYVIEDIITPIIRFIVGSLTVGWFYELYKDHKQQKIFKIVW